MATQRTETYSKKTIERPYTLADSKRALERDRRLPSMSLALMTSGPIRVRSYSAAMPSRTDGHGADGSWRCKRRQLATSDIEQSIGDGLSVLQRSANAANASSQLTVGVRDGPGAGAVGASVGGLNAARSRSLGHKSHAVKKTVPATNIEDVLTELLPIYGLLASNQLALRNYLKLNVSHFVSQQKSVCGRTFAPAARPSPAALWSDERLKLGTRVKEAVVAKATARALAANNVFNLPSVFSSSQFAEDEKAISKMHAL